MRCQGVKYMVLRADESAIYARKVSLVRPPGTGTECKNAAMPSCSLAKLHPVSRHESPASKWRSTLVRSTRLKSARCGAGHQWLLPCEDEPGGASWPLW